MKHLFGLGEEEYIAIKTLEREDELERENLKKDQGSLIYDPAIDKPNQKFYEYRKEPEYWE